MSSTGAQDAWRELETRVRSFVVRRVASPADADDVMQEVFVRMQRGLPALRQDDRLTPWAYQVARSALADHRRASARHPLTKGEVTDIEADTEAEDGPDLAMLQEVVAAYVARLVTTLPSPYREAITLTEIEGLTHKQAAEMMGVSLSGMKSRVQRGRTRLRAMLQQCCDVAVDARGRVVDCTPRLLSNGACKCSV